MSQKENDIPSNPIQFYFTFEELKQEHITRVSGSYMMYCFTLSLRDCIVTAFPVLHLNIHFSEITRSIAVWFCFFDSPNRNDPYAFKAGLFNSCHFSE